MNTRKVDVLINVYGKPFQTALSLLSLMKHSGHHIDKIWCVFDRPEVTQKLGAQVIETLLPNLVVHKPADWRWINHIDESCLDDTSYRHSIRYQYGWEHTDKDFVLTLHNDVYVTGDVVGLLLDNIDGHIAAGPVGQCVVCPAHHHGKCSSEKYLEYRPSLKEFLYLAAEPRGKVLTDVSNYMVCSGIRKKPWPLPMCRVNEWCALIDMHQARPITIPHGTARPFGAHVFEGVLGERQEGEEWKEFKNHLGIVMDTGIAWFRDVHHLGHTCRHVNIDSMLTHWTGHKALFNTDAYLAGEQRALGILEKEFGVTWTPEDIDLGKITP